MTDIMEIVHKLLSEVSFLFKPPHYRPYVVYGHSFGSIVAFEFVRSIQQEHFQQPKALICSGVTAPHLTYPASPIAELPDEQFRDAMYDRYESVLTPDPKLYSILIPPVRADMYAIEHYRFHYIAPDSLTISTNSQSDSSDIRHRGQVKHTELLSYDTPGTVDHPTEVPTPSISCKLIVVTGSKDTICHPEYLEQWRCHAGSEFETHVMEGCGHFYYTDPRMINIIRAELDNCLVKAGDEIIYFEPSPSPTNTPEIRAQHYTELEPLWKGLFTPTNVLLFFLGLAILFLVIIRLTN